MSAPTLDELYRLRTYYGCYINEIDREIVRRKVGKTPQSCARLAEAVTDEMGRIGGALAQYEPTDDQEPHQ